MTATPTLLPPPKTLPPSFRHFSPLVRALPRRLSTYRLVNSSARQARRPDVGVAVDERVGGDEGDHPAFPDPVCGPAEG